MDLAQYNNHGDNKVLAYVVSEENILGYLFKTNGFFRLGILHASVLRGASCGNFGGPLAILGGVNNTVRKATQADFDAFRVHSGGYDLSL